MLGRFCYKNQCNTIITKRPPLTVAGFETVGRNLVGSDAGMPSSRFKPLPAMPHWSIPLAVIVVGAFLLRVWGIEFGLPYLYHPDEPKNVLVAQTILKSGDLRPTAYIYGSLFYYLNAAAYLPYYGVGKLLGWFETLQDIPAPVIIAMGTGVTSAPETFLFGRLLSTLFGCGSVVLVFFCGRTLFLSNRAGLTAALLLCVSPIATRHDQILAPDSIQAFFILVGLWAAATAGTRPETKFYVLNGLAAGFAAAVKYIGVFAALPLIVAHISAHGWQGIKRRSLDNDKGLYFALGACLAAFSFSMPYALLDAQGFMAALYKTHRHYMTAQSGYEGDTVRFFLRLLARDEGPAVLLGGLFLLYGMVRREVSVFIGATFPVLYVLYIMRFEVRFDRTLLPVVPILLIFAGAAFARFWSWLESTRIGAVGGTIISCCLITVVAGYPAMNTINHNLRLVSPDGRETSRQWIEANIPAGSSIALESYAPYVDPKRYRVQANDLMIDHDLEWYRAAEVKYLVFSEGMYGRFFGNAVLYAAQIEKYSHLFDQLHELKIFNDGGYEVRVYRLPAE